MLIVVLFVVRCISCDRACAASAAHFLWQLPLVLPAVQATKLCKHVIQHVFEDWPPPALPWAQQPGALRPKPCHNLRWLQMKQRMVEKQQTIPIAWRYLAASQLCPGRRSMCPRFLHRNICAEEEFVDIRKAHGLLVYWNRHRFHYHGKLHQASVAEAFSGVTHASSVFLRLSFY